MGEYRLPETVVERGAAEDYLSESCQCSDHGPDSAHDAARERLREALGFDSSTGSR